MSKLSKWLRKAEKAVSKVIPHQHTKDRRDANRAVSEQVSFYQEQKAAMQKETARLEGERASERAKVGKKQIKSLRSAYRAPGFMEEAQSSYTDKLGE